MLRWSLERLTQCKVGTDMKAILPQLLNCMNDKSATVRGLAEQLLGLTFSKKGCKMKDVESAMEKLSASAKRTTSATVQRIFEANPVEKPAAEKPLPAAAAAAVESDATGATAAAPSEGPLEEPPSSVMPSPEKKRPPAPKGHHHPPKSPSAGGGGGGALALLVNRGKDRREKESWKTRWPVPPVDDPPGDKEAAKLQDDWAPCIARDKLGVFFPARTGSMDCGAEALELIADAVTHGDDLFLGHLDLLFKWFTLRLCERESSATLARLLEVLTMVVDNLVARGYELRDFEAAVIVPHILEKAGTFAGKERPTAAIRELMGLLSRCYPLNKYAPLVTKALKSKNSRTQAACLLEIARVVEASGFESVGVKGLKEVVKYVESRDSAVRNAALDGIQESYMHVGAKLYDFLGLEPSSKTHAMIDARLKRAPSPGGGASPTVGRSPGPAATAAVVSPVVSSATFNDEILARLDSLLLAAHPLDKQSSEYLEGKDVIKVIHSLASGGENAQFSFSRSSLVTHANAIISKLAACLNMSFVCSEQQSESDAVAGGGSDGSGNAGGMDVQLLSVCLAALMALFRLPELCREVRAPPLRDMLACTCSRSVCEGGNDENGRTDERTDGRTDGRTDQAY